MIITLIRDVLNWLTGPSLVWDVTTCPCFSNPPSNTVNLILKHFKGSRPSHTLCPASHSTDSTMVENNNLPSAFTVRSSAAKTDTWRTSQQRWGFMMLRLDPAVSRLQPVHVGNVPPGASLCICLTKTQKCWEGDSFLVSLPYLCLFPLYM